MALLDDIIEAATDDKHGISVVLRQCLQLGFLLDNETLKHWAELELDGYGSEDELPDYRIIEMGALGSFSGYFGRSISNAPIPSFMLDTEHRKFAETMHLRQSIKAYESMSGNDGATVPWPANLVMYYQRKTIYNDFTLTSAWQPLPASSMQEVVDNVRNKALKLALEINRSSGPSKDVAKIGKNTVESTVTNIIYGTGTIQVNSGQSGGSNIMTSGQVHELQKALAGVGIGSKEAEAVQQALSEDKHTIGSRVSEWIKHNANSVVVGGIKFGAEAAKPILQELIKQHLGV